MVKHCWAGHKCSMTRRGVVSGVFEHGVSENKLCGDVGPIGIQTDQEQAVMISAKKAFLFAKNA